MQQSVHGLHRAIPWLFCTALSIGVGIKGASAQSLAQIAVPTAPMGWASWNAFGTQISEAIIERQALALSNFNATLSYPTPKYNRLNIDDGFWMQSSGRNADGSPKIDPALWTNGTLTASVNTIHSLGLKAGAYTDAGSTGCAGAGGSEGYYNADFLRFAQQGFDFVKVDFCGGRTEGLDPKNTYAAVVQALQSAMAQTRRTLYMSVCDWGFYGPPGYTDSAMGPWTWAPGIDLIPADTWRTADDITFSVGTGATASFLDVLHNFHANNHPEAQHTGFYNDPDMMVVGLNGLDASTTARVQSRAHMSLWAVGGSPLILGLNLQTQLGDPTLRAIVGNSQAILIDQDPRGLPAIQVAAPAAGLEVWARLLSGSGNRAVVLLNTTSSTAAISVTSTQLGLLANAAMSIKDVWSRSTTIVTGTYTASVPANGAALLLVNGADVAAKAASLSKGVSAAGFVTYQASATPTTLANQAAINQGPTHLDIAYQNLSSATLAMSMSSNGGAATMVSFPPTGAAPASTVSVVNNLTAGSANTISFTAATLNAAPVLSGVSVVAGPVPAFQPAYQADSKTNTLSGTAVVAACSACSDGNKIGYIGSSGGQSGTLTFNNVTAPAAGNYRILVGYIDGGPDRQATVSVNGGAGQSFNFPSGKDWNTVQVAPIFVTLNKGANTLTFSNPSNYAPDISALTQPVAD
jgi:alpha-galactosidase